MFKNSAKRKVENRQENFKKLVERVHTKKPKKLEGTSTARLLLSTGCISQEKKLKIVRNKTSVSHLDRRSRTASNENSLALLRPPDINLNASDDRRVLRRSKRLNKTDLNTDISKIKTNFPKVSDYYLDLISKCDEQPSSTKNIENAVTTASIVTKIQTSKSILKQIDDCYNQKLSSPVVPNAVSNNYNENAKQFTNKINSDTVDVLQCDDEIFNETCANQNFGINLLQCVGTKVPNLKYKYIEKVNAHIKNINAALNSKSATRKSAVKKIKSAMDCSDNDVVGNRLPQSSWIYNTPKRQVIKYTASGYNANKMETCIMHVNKTEKFLFKVDDHFANAYNLEPFLNKKINIPIDNGIVTPVCKVSQTVMDVAFNQNLAWSIQENFVVGRSPWTACEEDVKENFDNVTFSVSSVNDCSRNWNSQTKLPFTFENITKPSNAQCDRDDKLLKLPRPSKLCKKVERTHINVSRQLSFVGDFPKRPKIFFEGNSTTGFEGIHLLGNKDSYGHANIGCSEVDAQKCRNYDNMFLMPATVTSQNINKAPDRSCVGCKSVQDSSLCTIKNWRGDNQGTLDRSLLYNNGVFMPVPPPLDDTPAIKYYPQKF